MCRSHVVLSVPPHLRLTGPTSPSPTYTDLEANDGNLVVNVPAGKTLKLAVADQTADVATVNHVDEVCQKYVVGACIDIPDSLPLLFATYI